jgi:hypothetical protein
MAISAVGEGCHKQMLNMLQSLVDSILPFLTDQHPRVRYAACNALGQLSTDFAEGFQQKFHAKVRLPFKISGHFLPFQAQYTPRIILIPGGTRKYSCGNNNSYM